jgi:hypothetical protein
MRNLQLYHGSVHSKKVRQLYLSFFFLALVSLIATTASADPNVTLNKPATLNGLFGALRPASGWDPTQPLGTAGTIDDGIFFPEQTLWNQGSIWWDATVPGSENNTIVIDLQGAYHITGIITQADNNDAYQIDYFNPFTSNWTGLGAWPNIMGYGLTTRPSGDQVTPFLITFDASMIRLSAFGGDGYYAYSEFQAFGTTVPEPATMLLLGSGLIGLAGYGRKKFFKK